MKPKIKEQFKFLPGDKVYAKFDKKKVVGIIDSCSISYNPVPKYWVIFETGIIKSVNHGLQGWYPEPLLKKAKPVKAKK